MGTSLNLCFFSFLSIATPLLVAMLFHLWLCLHTIRDEEKFISCYRVNEVFSDSFVIRLLDFAQHTCGNVVLYNISNLYKWFIDFTEYNKYIQFFTFCVHFPCSANKHEHTYLRTFLKL
jgi:hypothetical protein